MIVYVETNFVLELVLEQEAFQFAEALLTLAKMGKIELVLPSFSMLEPYWAITNRERQRKPFINAFSPEVENQLNRTAYYTNLFNNLKPGVEELKKVEEMEAIFLELRVEELLTLCRFVELNKATILQAQFNRKTKTLQLFDAIVYSSIISDLQLQEPTRLKCFVSQNSQDFRSVRL
jgi:hypothetical protein